MNELSAIPPDPQEIGGTHYQQGVKTSPWDLQLQMKSSGSAFVDARRADAIRYAFRLKGGGNQLLEDLRKAKHCLEAAITELEISVVTVSSVYAYSSPPEPSSSFKTK